MENLRQALYTFQRSNSFNNSDSAKMSAVAAAAAINAASPHAVNGNSAQQGKVDFEQQSKVHQWRVMFLFN